MILDTNFLIDVLRGRESALEKLEELDERKEPLLLPPGALFELYVGGGDVGRIENELERAKLTPMVEKEAARIRRTLEDRGEPISSIDYLIAGTARHLNEKLLTRDSHFDRIEGLETENF